MANFNDQLQRMKGLMTYGAVNEKKESKSGAMEYHALGADGKSYGIIRENQKFYIKVAPKSKAMVAEAYEYIGGFNNKKANEYTSYSNALKNFELKMMSLNEAHNARVNIESLRPFEADGEVMTEGTKEMMSEIARQRQIMNNVAAILNENTTISCKNTGVPEAPKTTSFNDKIGKPFEIAAKAELDGDFKKTSNSPEKQGEPFGDTAKAEEGKDAEYVPSGSVANQKPKGGKVVKVNESTRKMFEMMAKLDKSFTLNESCEDWGSCGLPSSEGVGSADGHLMEDENIAGFADESSEDIENTEDAVDPEIDFEEEPDFETEDEFEFDDEDFDAEDDMDMEVDDELEGEESEIDALRAEIDALRAEIASLKGEEPEMGDEFGDEEMPEMDDEFGDDEMPAEEPEMGDEEFGDEEMPEEELGEEFNPEADATYDEFDENELDRFDDEFGDDDLEDDEFAYTSDDIEELPSDEHEPMGIPESRKKELMPIIESLVKEMKKKNSIKEDKLNDFGKHPGYRKKPMTLPATGSDNENGMKDWNDESVRSEQPFGSKIGDSAPYDEVIKKITDSVVEAIIGKKKI